MPLLIKAQNAEKVLTYTPSTWINDRVNAFAANSTKKVADLKAKPETANTLQTAAQQGLSRAVNWSQWASFGALGVTGATAGNVVLPAVGSVAAAVPLAAAGIAHLFASGIDSYAVKPLLERAAGNPDQGGKWQALALTLKAAALICFEVPRLLFAAVHVGAAIALGVIGATAGVAYFGANAAWGKLTRKAEVTTDAKPETKAAPELDDKTKADNARVKAEQDAAQAKADAEKKLADADKAKADAQAAETLKKEQTAKAEDAAKASDVAKGEEIVKAGQADDAAVNADAAAAALKLEEAKAKEEERAAEAQKATQAIEDAKAAQAAKEVEAQEAIDDAKAAQEAQEKAEADKSAQAAQAILDAEKTAAAEPSAPEATTEEPEAAPTQVIKAEVTVAAPKDSSELPDVTLSTEKKDAA